MEKKKILIPKHVVMILSLAVGLIIARIIIFKSSYFVYLFWNLFLALLPFVVSSVLLWHMKYNKIATPLLVLGGIIWLALLPNAPYIVTDLIHLGRNHAAPMLYDTFMLFSAAWAGLLLGIYSISHIEKILRMKFSVRDTSYIIGGLIFLESFGIYLGRFMRYNSWDIVTRPGHFLNNLGNILLRPLEFSDAYIFTGLCFVFLLVSYRAWKYSLEEARSDIM